jgi:hypothetical protein
VITARKLVDNAIVTGDSVTVHPQTRMTSQTTEEKGVGYPHGGGDKILGIHQEGGPVVHNPQPLLPLLTTYVSHWPINGWGHSRKDTLR